MKNLAPILFALASALTCTADAASLPLLEQALQPSSQAESSARRPEPADLTVEWWSYFEVDTLELDRRIIETSQGFQALLAALPEDTAEKAHGLVERIETNMDALANARLMPEPSPPEPKGFSPTYTVSALAEVMSRLHRSRDRLRVERADIASMDQTIRLAQQRLDSQLATYVKLSSDDPDRVLKGLEIMAERFALAVAGEQRRLTRAALAIREAEAEQLAAEQALAAARLVAEKADLERLDKQIAAATLSLEQTREQSLAERSRALEVLGGAPEDRATVRYRRQRVVKAAVLEADAAVRLLGLQAERRFTVLLLNGVKKDFQDLRRQVLAWKETLTDIRDQAMYWADASRQEWSRLNEERIEAGL